MRCNRFTRFRTTPFFGLKGHKGAVLTRFPLTRFLIRPSPSPPYSSCVFPLEGFSKNKYRRYIGNFASLLPLFAAFCCFLQLCFFDQIPVVPTDPFVKNHPPRLRDRKPPPLDRLRVLFEYNPESGTLYSKHTGEPVGTPDPCGHLLVSIDGCEYYVHHVVWHIFHNTPCHGNCRVSHVNCNLSDNSILNLTRKRMRWFSRR